MASLRTVLGGSGVKSVQSGSAGAASAGDAMAPQTVNITIGAVNTNKSFVLLSVRNIGVSHAAPNCTAQFTSATNLMLVFGAMPPNSNFQAIWQVVEYY